MTVLDDFVSAVVVLHDHHRLDEAFWAITCEIGIDDIADAIDATPGLGAELVRQLRHRGRRHRRWHRIWWGLR